MVIKQIMNFLILFHFLFQVMKDNNDYLNLSTEPSTNYITNEDSTQILLDVLT